MATDELTDDYIASLLAQDAKESSIRYSTVGLEAFARSKPPVNKPKPNTRFLRNIIKDTDSHNAALLAKEAAESRARLQTLATGNPQRAGRAHGGGDIRRRQLGDIAAILGGGSVKRRRIDGMAKEGRRVNTSSEDEPEERIRPKREREEQRQESEVESISRSRKIHYRRHRSVSEEREKDGKMRRDRPRSRSPREHRSKDKESRRRHRSPRRKRSRSSEPENHRDKSSRSHRHRRSPSRAPSRERRSSKSDCNKPKRPDYDSDPLDDIIGPQPAPIPEVRRKGRGTISHASGIDSHFSANYDPTVDVQLDFDEEDDWDQALEALKDRQKWKQQGADRLRAAGFTEDEVGKWEKGGEKRQEDVVWSKKGEGREWDRGKIVDEYGAVTIEPKFGRLTDA